MMSNVTNKYAGAGSGSPACPARKLPLAVTLCAMVLAAFAVACTMFAAPAYANIQLDAPTTVSDDITRIHVNKLDADTHEFVVGAKMVILNEETGEVVDEWVTGSSTYKCEKDLDVDVVYVLRELQAPDGFSTVEDVRFVVNEMEGTGITILSQGNDAELTGSYKVNLYDKAGETEVVTEVTQTRTTTTYSSPSKTVAPKTGDETPLLPIGVLAVVGILAIVVLQLYKRRMAKEEDAE